MTVGGGCGDLCDGGAGEDIPRYTLHNVAFITKIYLLTVHMIYMVYLGCVYYR